MHDQLSLAYPTCMVDKWVGRPARVGSNFADDRAAAAAAAAVTAAILMPSASVSCVDAVVRSAGKLAGRHARTRRGGKETPKQSVTDEQKPNYDQRCRAEDRPKWMSARRTLSGEARIAPPSCRSAAACTPAAACLRGWNRPKERLTRVFANTFSRYSLSLSLPLSSPSYSG